MTSFCLAPAHRRAPRPGLLPRLPLLLRPLRGTPLLPGRRPASRQVIGARRHRGVPGIPGRGPHGRVQLPPQLRDQRGQRLNLPRLLADQRITRILRRQRLGHATRSSPKPAQPAAATTPRSATVTSTSLTQRHPKLKQTRGRECLPPDCRQIVTRLRSGINRRSDRRTTSTGQSSLVNVHANRPLTPLLRRIDRQQSVRWGRGAGRQNRSRELAVPAACPIDQASGVSHGYQRTALHPR